MMFKIMNNDKTLLRLFVVLFSLSLTSCGGLKEDDNGLTVINVLEKELYDDCRIKGSINVPFSDVEEYVKKNFNKKSKIVLYCSNYMCSASGHACEQLRRAGFANVYAYEAGMAEWYQEKLPVEGPCRATYLQHRMAYEKDNEKEQINITTSELARELGLAS